MVTSKKRIGPFLIISAVPIVMAGILMFGESWERYVGMILGAVILGAVWLDFFCFRSSISDQGFFRTYELGKMQFDVRRIDLEKIKSIHVAKKGFAIKYQDGGVEKIYGVFTRGWSNAPAFIEWFREKGVVVEAPK